MRAYSTLMQLKNKNYLVPKKISIFLWSCILTLFSFTRASVDPIIQFLKFFFFL